MRLVAATLALAGLLAVAYLLVRDDGGSPLPGETLPETPPAKEGFRLEQNQPNPFQESTALIYAIPERLHVTLQVYNTLGAPVATLVDALQEPGFHQVEWDGRDRNGNRLPGGVYFYQLTAGDRRELRRMVMLP